MSKFQMRLQTVFDPIIIPLVIHLIKRYVNIHLTADNDNFRNELVIGRSQQETRLYNSGA